MPSSMAHGVLGFLKIVLLIDFSLFHNAVISLADFEVKIRPKNYWPSRIVYVENIRNGYEYKCLNPDNELEYDICQYCPNVSCFIFEQKNKNLTNVEINSSKYIMTCQESDHLPQTHEVHTFLDCVQIGNGTEYTLFIYEREYIHHYETPIVNIIDPYFLKWVENRNQSLKGLELGFRMKKLPEKLLAVNSKIIQNFTSICIDSRELSKSLFRKNIEHFDDYTENQMIIFSQSGLVKNRKPPNPPTQKVNWYNFYPNDVTLCEIDERYVILDKLCSLKVYNPIKPLHIPQKFTLKDDLLINYTIFEPYPLKSNELQNRYYLNSKLYLLGILFFSFLSSISLFIWNNRKNYSFCFNRASRKKSYAQNNAQIYPDLMKMYGPYMGQPNAPIPANFQQNDPGLMMMRQQFYQR